MGRHSAGPRAFDPASDDRGVAPITDPRLFDGPLPGGPAALPSARPTRSPAPSRRRVEHDRIDEVTATGAAQPFQPVSVRRTAPRGADEVLPRVASASLLGVRAQNAGPIRPRDQRYARTGPIPIMAEESARRSPLALTRTRETALAAAALAVVGALSGAAALLPSNGSEAEAAATTDPVTSPVPTASASSSNLLCFTPQQVKRAMRLHHHRLQPPHTARPLSPETISSTSPTASTSSSATPTTSESSTPTTDPSTAGPSTAPSSGGSGTGSSSPASAGALPAAPSHLGAGTYTLRDFSTQSSGAVISGGVLKGAGIGKTVVKMVQNTSTRASAVPGNGNNQGGLSNPVNPLYLLRGVNRLEDVTVQGSAQGHLYNGVYMSGADIVIKHAEVDDIPGDSHANPGETFAVNVNRATGTNTVDDLTINGGTGSLASAAGLAINNSDADWNISDLTTRNLKYSAGIALWQVHGTFNIHNYVQSGGARALGAERMAGKVNLYDPVWSAGTTGHDVTYTWDGGYTGGSINFHYSSAAKVPKRKIVVITNHASGIAGSIHVYIGGVEQTASKYVTVN